MSAALVALIEHTGSLLRDQITTSPWKCAGIKFPDNGGVPFKPQFNLEVLEPINVDGARFRVGGAHFPRFRLISVVPCSTFAAAKKAAREHELCKGETVAVTHYDPSVQIGEDQTYNCYVLDVKAVANASRILGATASGGGDTGSSPPGGGATETAALATVDTEWILKVQPL